MKKNEWENEWASKTTISSNSQKSQVYCETTITNMKLLVKSVVSRIKTCARWSFLMKPL